MSGSFKVRPLRVTYLTLLALVGYLLVGGWGILLVAAGALDVELRKP